MADPLVTRVGVALLDSDISLEPELARCLQGVLPVHVARISYPGTVTEESLDVASRHLLTACQQLMPARPDLLVYACTSGSFVAGPERNRELRAQVGRAAGVPLVSAIDAVEHALRLVRSTRVGVVSPYSSNVTARLVAYLDSCGVETLSTELLVGDREIDDWTLQNPDPADLVAACERAAASGAGAVFVSCTGLRVLDLVEDLEEQLGIPVISSNLAIIRTVADLAAIALPLAPGRLLGLPAQIPDREI